MPMHIPYVSLCFHTYSLYVLRCQYIFIMFLYMSIDIPYIFYMCPYIFYIVLKCSIHILYIPLSLHEYSIHLLMFQYIFHMFHYIFIRVSCISLDVHTYSLCFFMCPNILLICLYICFTMFPYMFPIFL